MRRGDLSPSAALSCRGTSGAFLRGIHLAGVCVSRGWVPNFGLYAGLPMMGVLTHVPSVAVRWAVTMRCVANGRLGVCSPVLALYVRLRVRMCVGSPALGGAVRVMWIPCVGVPIRWLAVFLCCPTLWRAVRVRRVSLVWPLPILWVGASLLVRPPTLRGAAWVRLVRFVGASVPLVPLVRWGVHMRRVPLCVAGGASIVVRVVVAGVRTRVVLGCCTAWLGVPRVLGSGARRGRVRGRALVPQGDTAKWAFKNGKGHTSEKDKILRSVCTQTIQSRRYNRMSCQTKNICSDLGSLFQIAVRIS